MKSIFFLMSKFDKVKVNELPIEKLERLLRYIPGALLTIFMLLAFQIIGFSQQPSLNNPLNDVNQTLGQNFQQIASISKWIALFSIIIGFVKLIYSFVTKERNMTTEIAMMVGGLVVYIVLDIWI